MTADQRHRCRTCGHDDSEPEHAPVTEYKGVRLCCQCREGIETLEAEDGWFQDPDTLEWINPHPEPAWLTERRDRVTDLAFKLRDAGCDVIDIHPTSFVAVQLARCYRLHVYPDTLDRDLISVRLFTPGRRIVPIVSKGVVTLADGQDTGPAIARLASSDVIADAIAQFEAGQN